MTVIKYNQQLQSPWEGVAAKVDAPTIDKVITDAGLDWRVVEDEILNARTKTVIQGKKALSREDTGDTLGVVGDGYEVLQNAEAFAFMDTLASAGKMKYVGAGNFSGGKRLFVQAEITNWGNGNDGGFEVVPGDGVKPYLLLCNSHDGSGSVRVFLSAIRVSCQNTMNAALATDSRQQRKKRNADTSISIKHTKSLQERLQAATSAFTWAQEHFHRFSLDARKFASRRVKATEASLYFRNVFEADAGALSGAESNRQERLLELMEIGAGNNLPGVQGTLWAAVNAVTQYLGHEQRTAVRGIDTESMGPDERDLLVRSKRFESNTLGNGAKISDRAYELALELV